MSEFVVRHKVDAQRFSLYAKTHTHTCTQNSPSAPTRMLTSWTGVCRRACLGQFQQTRIQASSLLPPEHVLFGVVKWKKMEENGSWMRNFIG